MGLRRIREPKWPDGRSLAEPVLSEVNGIVQSQSLTTMEKLLSAITLKLATMKCTLTPITLSLAAVEWTLAGTC